MRPDRNSKFAEPDEMSKRIAAQIIDSFAQSKWAGCRKTCRLCSPVSAMWQTPCWPVCRTAGFDNLTGFTEVLQDGMLI